MLSQRLHNKHIPSSNWHVVSSQCLVSETLHQNTCAHISQNIKHTFLKTSSTPFVHTFHKIYLIAVNLLSKQS
uniref:Uncharacterized protein n=1 Tax=Arion vulgaris TaxID=1028688 RepID=A0A0B6ZL84_9EUPU